MKEIKLECFEEFHKKVQSYNKNADIYRGVTDKDYQLVPKIGWIALKKNRSRRKEEGRIFRRFKERALPYLNFIPRNNWDWLALAQHHGLPTRLLDWT